VARSSPLNTVTPHYSSTRTVRHGACQVFRDNFFHCDHQYPQSVEKSWISVATGLRQSSAHPDASMTVRSLAPSNKSVLHWRLFV
jgi:hypothetical protein